MHDRRLHPGLDHTPGIPEGIVDVWLVDLREVGTEPLQLLSAGERKRAADISNPARRALWMRARGVLRMLLGGYLQRPAGELEFVLGEHGKPALVASPRGGAGELLAGAGDSAARTAGAGAGGLHFNLSHSEALALYAFTAAAPVGVDLELKRERKLDELALAERTFGAQAALSLRRLDAPTRRREFLRLWVRHEATLKCLGYGLAGRQEQSGLEKHARGLWVTDLDLGPDIAAALAVRQGPLELRLSDWPVGS